jgi:hypothetical protein
MLRDETFEPYREGMGPKFRLEMWATSRNDRRGQTIIGYQLSEITSEGTIVPIFEGEDFAGSPLHADDSDETLRSLLGFLTLRPSDTDREYFENYTERQMDFVRNHAEALSMFALDE